jgi:hypothetical protein
MVDLKTIKSPSCRRLSEVASNILLTPYAVFDPNLLGIPDNFATETHNNEIEDKWTKLLDSPENQIWCDEIHSSVTNALLRSGTAEKY